MIFFFIKNCLKTLLKTFLKTLLMTIITFSKVSFFLEITNYMNQVDPSIIVRNNICNTTFRINEIANYMVNSTIFLLIK